MTTLRLLPDLEESLRLLPGVHAASVITGPDAKPTEIHVLAASGKQPKQIVRDVQSLAMARYEIDIDHRIVSVVQFDDGESGLDMLNGRGEDEGKTADRGAEGSAAPRPVISSISLKTSGAESEVTVSLALGDTTFEGHAAGSGSTTYRHTLIARATLDAVSELLGIPADVEHAGIVDCGHRRVAVCVIQVVVPRLGDQSVTGSALVRGDETDALARAVLNALNRRLAA
jgi:hypothetical protein